RRQLVALLRRRLCARGLESCTLEPRAVVSVPAGVLAMDCRVSASAFQRAGQSARFVAAVIRTILMRFLVLIPGGTGASTLAACRDAHLGEAVRINTRADDGTRAFHRSRFFTENAPGAGACILPTDSHLSSPKLPRRAVVFHRMMREGALREHRRSLRSCSRGWQSRAPLGLRPLRLAALSPTVA